ncbi:MAG TPA: antitoxin Xre-like helix-turn-helix domain-containing protein [Hanamia sp.]|nr:antitoxin Xre-like helix-turn-helix domain-containing protein [Hanamia sp.]
MKSKKYKNTAIKSVKAEEPEAVYYQSQPIKISRDISFSDFKKMASKVDFTQKEWADILHISERTLQRYAHNDGSFSSGTVDRLYQINKVFQRGKEVFGSYQKFNLWLRDNPYMLEGRLSLHSLASIEGINNVLTQLGRIEHGIFA